MKSRRTPRSSASPPTGTTGAADPAGVPGAAGWRALGCVMAAALLIRLLLVFWSRQWDPWWAWLEAGFDQYTFQEWAVKIVRGDWLLREVGIFYFSPLFAYFSAVVYTVCGERNYLALHLAQATLGTGTTALVFVLARTWLAPRWALLATALFSLAAPVLFYEQALLIEGLMMASWSACLWGLRTATWTPQEGAPAGGLRCPAVRLWLAGAALGVAIIGRGNALAFLPAAVAWLLLRGGAPDVAGRRQWRPGRAAWLRAGWFVLGAAVVMGMFAARNATVSGRWTLGMTNGPVQFYLGNARDATGTFVYSSRFEAAQKEAQGLGAAQAAAVYRRYLLEDLRAAPGAIAWNLLRKARYFWGANDYPDNLNFQLAARLLPTVGWNPVRWVWLVPLGMLGLLLMALGHGRGASDGVAEVPRNGGLLWLFVLVFAASFIAILPTGRYRPPVLIAVAIGAGAAAQWLAAAWSGRHWRAWALAVAGWGGLVLLVWPWGPPLIRSNDYRNAFSAVTQASMSWRYEPLYQQATAAFPKLAGAWATFELEWLLKQPTASAPADLTRAVARMQSAPGWPYNGLIALTQGLGLLGRYDEARHILAIAERQHPDDPAVRDLRRLLDAAPK